MNEPGPVPQRLAFTPTRDDYEALLKRLDSRPVSISLILAGAVLTGLIWGMFDPGWYGELALLPLIGAAALVLFTAAHLFRRLRRALRVARWRAPPEPAEIQIFDDRLNVRENGGARDIAWTSLLAAAADEGRVYLTVLRGDAVVIPRAAFASAAQMRDFALTCQKRLSEPDKPDAEPVAATPSAPAPAQRPALREEALRVEFTLAPADAAEVERSLRHDRSAGAVMSLPAASLAAGLTGGVAGGAAAFAVTAGLDARTQAIAVGAAALAGAILLTFLGARRIEGARADEWPDGDPRRAVRRVEIDEAGLVTHGTDFEMRIAWAGVESIRETEQHVLFITRWKEIYAVPKRCFANADAGHAFVSKARALKTAS